MRRRALEVLACPSCHGTLELRQNGDGEVDSGTLRCPRDRMEFIIESGVPALILPDQLDRLNSFAAEYQRVWQREGWGGRDPRYLLKLPYRDVTGRQRGKWRVKARSMEVLLPLLVRERVQRVVDLGCGMGWLSHHIARLGVEVFAVDVLRDEALGLRAGGTYVRRGPYFERIQGELERPPFRTESIDAVVCNASLHYAESLPKAVAGIERILRPGGLLAVLNSPVHHDASSARRAEFHFREQLKRQGATETLTSTYHHFTWEEIISVLGASLGPPREEPFDPGLVFRTIRFLKGMALRMELASFPIVTATKSGRKAGDGQRLRDVI